MIVVNRLDGSEFVLNGLLIETIEKTPDTIITLTTGKRYIVKQSVEEVVKAVEEFLSKNNYFNINI